MKIKKPRQSSNGCNETDQLIEKENRDSEAIVRKNESTHGFMHIKPLLTDVCESVQTLSEWREDNQANCIPTGFAELDHLICGFHPGELVILAGPPSIGKTTLALNIASNIAVATHLTVGVFSLGLRGSEIAMRMMLSTGKLDYQRISSGCLNDGEWSRLSFSLNKLHDAPIYIDETSGITIEQLSSKSRCLHQQCGRIGLIVLDHLQLMDRHQCGNGEAATYSPELKEIKLLAKELDTPIIVISQILVEAKKKKSKRPTIQDLHNSGINGRDADMVLLLFRKHLNSWKAPTEEIAECILLKQRNGPSGKIKLAFMREYPLFESVTDRQEFFAEHGQSEFSQTFH